MMSTWLHLSALGYSFQHWHQTDCMASPPAAAAAAAGQGTSNTGATAAKQHMLSATASRTRNHVTTICVLQKQRSVCYMTTGTQPEPVRLYPVHGHHAYDTLRSLDANGYCADALQAVAAPADVNCTLQAYAKTYKKPDAAILMQQQIH